MSQNNKDKMKKAIQAKIGEMMERVMERVLVTDPFIEEAFRTQKPLYAALVPDEIFKGSHFERRFVTPFGNIWEDLAVTATTHGIGIGKKGVIVSGNIPEQRLNRINEVLRRLEHPEKGAKRIQPDWDEELRYILDGKGGAIPTQVMVDFLAEDRATGNKYAFEIKAPLPNSDQTKVSKEKILKLYAMEPRPVTGAYYALPYNPYGKRENYAWSFPARWFNMKKDAAVLIGDEFWEKIGGSGTYQAFIEAVNEMGKEYKLRIYREFLQIDPPTDAEEINELR